MSLAPLTDQQRDQAWELWASALSLPKPGLAGELQRAARSLDASNQESSVALVASMIAVVGGLTVGCMFLPFLLLTPEPSRLVGVVSMLGASALSALPSMGVFVAKRAVAESEIAASAFQSARQSGASPLACFSASVKSAALYAWAHASTAGNNAARLANAWERWSSKKTSAVASAWPGERLKPLALKAQARWRAADRRWMDGVAKDEGEWFREVSIRALALVQRETAALHLYREMSMDQLSARLRQPRSSFGHTSAQLAARRRLDIAGWRHQPARLRDVFLNVDARELDLSFRPSPELPSLLDLLERQDELTALRWRDPEASARLVGLKARVEAQEIKALIPAVENPGPGSRRARL